MTAPVVVGIHHLKLPVSDLDRSLAWYRRVFAASHLVQFDHFDGERQRFAVIILIPGCAIPVELRWAPAAAVAVRSYDPVSFAVGTRADLEAWRHHLDELGIANSGIAQGGAGELMVFADPDGTFLRLMTVPQGGVAALTMPAKLPEPDGPWLNPPLMQHPAREH